MTIEKEAVYIWKDLVKHGKVSIITKALQAKQDRIEELEQELKSRMDQIVYAKAELRRCYDKINELENELRAYDLDIYGADGAKEISNMRKRIAELESALKPFVEEYEWHGNHGPFAHGLFQRAKKAIGGGNGND